MLTWVICGAGRGVGKTHLAQELCRVLPDSVYAKQGCGTPKPGKSPNLFPTERDLARFVDACHKHAHAVVESNAWARLGRGDIIIFIEGLPEHTDCRTDVDVLQSNSNLRLGHTPSLDEWEGVLRPYVTNAALRHKVCTVLNQASAYLAQRDTPSGSECPPE